MPASLSSALTSGRRTAAFFRGQSEAHRFDSVELQSNEWVAMRDGVIIQLGELHEDYIRGLEDKGVEVIRTFDRRK